MSEQPQIETLPPDIDWPLVERHARAMWDRRERDMWGPGGHFAKQTWEQGTELAKAKALWETARELYPLDTR
jgi:hypothetical protein